MSDTVKAQMDAMVKELLDHEHRYYVLNEPVISDLEFDMLLKQLEALEWEYPQYRSENSPSLRVGGGITKDFPSQRHQSILPTCRRCER